MPTGVSSIRTCLKRDEVIKFIRTGRGFLLGGISHIIQLAVGVCRGKEKQNHRKETRTPERRAALGDAAAEGQEFPSAPTGAFGVREGALPPGTPPPGGGKAIWVAAPGRGPTRPFAAPTGLAPGFVPTPPWSPFLFLVSSLCLFPASPSSSPPRRL